MSRAGLLLISARDIHFQPLLYNEESGIVLQRPARVDQFETISPHQLGQQLVDLQERKVPTNAQMAAAAKLSEKQSV